MTTTQLTLPDGRVMTEERIRELLGLTDYGPRCCDVCGWTLAISAEEGCVQGNCSYRPRENSDEYRRIRDRRDGLALLDAVRQADRGWDRERKALRDAEQRIAVLGAAAKVAVEAYQDSACVVPACECPACKLDAALAAGKGDKL